MDMQVLEQSDLTQALTGRVAVVTGSTSGSGLGLALVAKIVNDHGGIVECESQPRRTIFRVLMPIYSGDGELIDVPSSTKRR